MYIAVIVSNSSNCMYGGMEVWRYGGMEGWRDCSRCIDPSLIKLESSGEKKMEWYYY